jgi:D-alanyl-lipoteichoic acid acyltransferase DltB (MBOAT superfamily)
MTFDSLTFVVFFIVVVAMFNLPGLSWSARKNILLAASFLFYGAWNPPFLLLLIGSASVDWWLALRMASARPQRRRPWLIVSLVANLGLLGFFKYGDFLRDNTRALLAIVGVDWQPAAFDILLPVGISFYTFQSLSYCIDVYRGEVRAQKSLRDYLLFVGFFPQLVAGPIVRYHDFSAQLHTPRRTTADGFTLGLSLLLIGLFEKIVLADSVFAPVADPIFKAGATIDSAGAWTGTIAFAGQIFCDFAGYSTCAIGCAAMLGFWLPDNFRSPYAAAGFSDFWRRWHISLSTWLRDYLYVPLGGNRNGAARTYVNLMLTMLLGGLWHGAAWTFVVWGGLHGSYLAAERWLKPRLGHLAVWRTWLGRVALAALTYFLVNLTWVFFRAQDFATADRMIRSMLLLDRGGAPVMSTWFLLSTTVAIGALLVAHWRMRDQMLHDAVSRWPAALVGSAWGAMLFLIAITQGGGNAFIYFQF